MPCRPYEVERLAGVLIGALQDNLLLGTGENHEGATTPDEILSAYMTACNTAILASLEMGANVEVIRECLQDMLERLPNRVLPMAPIPKHAM